MKFQIFTATLYTSLALVSAIPQPAAGDASALEARAITIANKPSNDWECPGKDGKTVTYKAKEIITAIEKGVELAKDNKQVRYCGDNPFPSLIKFPSSLPGISSAYEDNKNIEHFPMKSGKGAFNGARPAKAERVMYLHDGKADEAEFIGLWTHEGAATGQFKQCHKKA